MHHSKNRTIDLTHKKLTNKFYVPKIITRFLSVFASEILLPHNKMLQMSSILSSLQILMTLLLYDGFTFFIFYFLLLLTSMGLLLCHGRMGVRFFFFFYMGDLPM